MQTYSLIVKAACEHEAAGCVRGELPGVEVLDAWPTRLGSQHVVVVCSTRDLGLPLNQWVVRDRVAPFPMGALLYWHEATADAS